MADLAIIPESGKKASTYRKRKAQHPLSAFNDRLDADGWFSPDTYGRDFASAGDFSAVYMFLVVDDWPDMRFHIAYVGMSTRLERRWATHPTLRKIRDRHEWVKRLFKPTPKALLRTEERRYIQEYLPPWNIIGRVPGQ